MHNCTRFLLLGFLFFLIPVHVMADEISVTGSIPPKATDVQFVLERETAMPVAENETVTYKITYGSRLYYSAPVTLEAAWDPGIVQGTGQSVNIAEYRSGSATSAYANAPAVIDLINRKITWEIPAFPANLQNQSVSFSLITNAVYTGTRDVAFTVRAKAALDGYSVPEQSSITTYRYITQLVPTPSAYPAAAVATPTLTPTPTIPAPFSRSIRSVSLRSITASSMRLDIELPAASSLIVAFSRSPTGAAQKVILPFSPDLKRTVDLDKLEENTSYYVRITATDPYGNQSASDLYVFKTALSSSPPEVIKDSLLVTSDNYVLLDGKADGSSGSMPVVVAPEKQTLVVKFRLNNAQVRKVQAAIRNRTVLGISSSGEDAQDSGLADAFEIATGTYVVTYRTPSRPGAYEIIIRIEDAAGNIVERKIANLNVSESFKVFDSARKIPLEAVRVTLYLFNPRTGSYVLLPPRLFSFQNPSLTTGMGEVTILLPSGKYLARLQGIGYGEKEIPFTLGSGPDEGYPQIYLTPQPFSVGTAAKYYWAAGADVLAQSQIYLASMSSSNRFFELNAFIATALLVILTGLSFSSRLRVPFRSLFAYLSHHGNIAVFRREDGEAINGQVCERTSGEAVPGAEVFLIETRLGKTVSHVRTDAAGRFRMHKLKTERYRIEVMADGHERGLFELDQLQANGESGFVLHIGRGVPGTLFIWEAGQIFENFLSVIFELLLVVSLVFEMSLGSVFGWAKALPFLAASCINLGGWLVHLAHLKKLRER